MQNQLVIHMDNDENNFYFMINPYFPTAEMMDELSKNLPHLIRYYPSNQSVIANKISRIENIAIPLIAVNGSCEAIRILLQNYSNKLLVTVPNFNEWEITDHVSIPYHASFEEMKAVIETNHIDMVCFCNPNNPTGFFREDIQRLADTFPDVNFAVDISFIDFVAKDIPAYPHGKNVILVKSLGKNYGICGIRLGYIASENENLLTEIIHKIPIWNINSISEFLLDLIHEHRDEYEASRIKIIQGTQSMAEFLKQFDFLKVFPTKANFVMIKTEKKLNFNIKSCDNKTGLDDTYYRVAYNPDFEKLGLLLNQ